MAYLLQLSKVCILILVCYSVAVNVKAIDREQVTTPPKFIVGVWFQSKPLIFNDMGQQKGILVDVLTLAAKQQGLDVEVRYFPPGRGASEILHQRVDAVIQAGYVDEHSGDVKYWDGGKYSFSSVMVNEPIVTLRVGLLSFSGNGFTLGPSDILDGLKVGGLRSPIVSDEARDVYFGVSAVWVKLTSFQALLRLLKMKRVDLVAGPLNLIKQAELDGFSEPLIVVREAPPASLMLGITKSEKAQVAADKFGAEMSRLRSEGEIYRLLKSHSVLDYYLESKRP